MNLSRTAALAGGLSILLTLAGPALAHFRIMAPAAGFGLFMLGLLLGVAAFVLGCVGLSQARRTRAPRRPAVLGLISGILICSFLSVLVMTRGFRTTPGECHDLVTCSAAGVDGFYAAAYRPNRFVVDQLRAFKTINDISTNLENPPAFSVATALGGDWEFPEASKVGQPLSYPDVKTAYAGGPPHTIFPVALAIAEEKGWNIVVRRPDFYAFEATVETEVFRFVDDISVQMRSSPRCPRPMDGRCNSTAVETRSKSRDGLTDAGKNAARILEFNQRLWELTVESAPRPVDDES